MGTVTLRTELMKLKLRNPLVLSLISTDDCICNVPMESTQISDEL